MTRTERLASYAMTAALVAFCAWLGSLASGCRAAGEPTADPSVGPVPAVARRDDFVAAHAAQLVVILDQLDGVELSPAAAILVAQAQGHAKVIAATLPAPTPKALDLARATITPDSLGVLLHDAGKLAEATVKALDDKAAKREALAVRAAKQQARVDALAEVFTWLASLCGIAANACALAFGASFVLASQFPTLAAARRAIACVGLVAGIMAAVWAGAVLALGYPWLFGVLGLVLAGAIAAGIRYLYRLQPPPAQ